MACRIEVREKGDVRVTDAGADGGAERMDRKKVEQDDCRRMLRAGCSELDIDMVEGNSQAVVVVNANGISLKVEGRLQVLASACGD